MRHRATTPTEPAAAVGSVSGPGRALAAVVLAAVLLGTTGTVAALGPDALGPSTTAVWRTVIGGVALVAAAAVGHRAPWRYRWAPGATVLGAGAVAVNQLAFFAAIDRTGVAVGTLVTIAAVPVAAGVLDRMTGRAPRVRWVAGVAVAVAGVAVLGGTGEAVDPLGIALAAASGSAAAVVGFAIQRLLRDRPVLPAVATVIGGGAVVVLPLALADAGRVTASVGATATVAYLGLVSMAGAYVLWGTGLRHLTLGVVAAVTLLEPAVAAALAVGVLGEPAGPGLFAGIALVIVGVALASSPAAAPAVAGGGGAAWRLRARGR